ncbi:MAG: NADH:flavin oxidoreductase/NADH oxidase family protein, partial [Pseudomonadota bacterium]
MQQSGPLFEPLELPCGCVLKNRIAKSAMSDSLGDGTGHPTADQGRLYRRWADGGLAVSIIGEVQGTPDYAEKPGNLVLNTSSDLARFRALSEAGRAGGAQLWLQLGHAGALAYAPTSVPKGPSALDLPGLTCDALSVAEIEQVVAEFARTARLAQEAGFGGVQIHAAHGFLLSQFLSPLFNKRTDRYGGAIDNRMRLLVESIEAVREAVGPNFPIAVKLNATDQLEGGLTGEDALQVVAVLDDTTIDLLDISGGTYFPGAKSASDAAGGGPYFQAFAIQAKALTSKPLMLTGGFKTYDQAEAAIASGAADVIGLARALILEPDLPTRWAKGDRVDPEFPRFANAPEGGITAWYTMRLTALGAGAEEPAPSDLQHAITAYETRDQTRTEIWLRHFGKAQG